MAESKFQRELIAELKFLFPGCFVLKNDEQYLQGVPDLTLLWGGYWAVLECKDSMKSRYQPNQEYYIDKLNKMSFSAMICPENKEQVIDELQRVFGTRR